MTTAGPIAPDLRSSIETCIADYDRRWSRFRADSAVWAIAEGGRADFGADAPALLGLLLDLAERTDGAMTPLIGGALEHLGYDIDYTLQPGTGFRPAPSTAALRLDGTEVVLDEPALIDVGAAGKGQLVDHVFDLLAAAGHEAVLVDGGRDLRAGGPTVRAALEHPFDPESAIGVIELTDAALCASATNRRSWDALDGRGRLHHVLDGRTGRPVDSIAATWVLAATTMLADALSTALFFTPPDSLSDYAFSWVVMTTDGRAAWSDDLPGEVFR